MNLPTFTEQYRTADRSGWPPGPWDDEPDKVVWIDDSTRLDCMIVRNRYGQLCGYVGVPASHPWHGIDYSNEGLDLAVHGGVTYAAPCEEDGHAFDLSPRPEYRLDDAHFDPPYRAQYRDLPYVVAEVERLAAQLAVRCCRECGCTQERACAGGCWWAPDHPDGGALCSACAARLGLPLGQQA